MLLRPRFSSILGKIFFATATEVLFTELFSPNYCAKYKVITIMMLKIKKNNVLVL